MKKDEYEDVEKTIPASEGINTKYLFLKFVVQFISETIYFLLKRFAAT